MKVRLVHGISVFVVLATALVASLSPLPANAQEEPNLNVSARRYIVIDADTGEVFAQRDANDQVAIASLTKVYTTIEALSRAPLDTIVTTNESDLFDASSTTMGFGPGESFTLEELLYGMMLPSGNDAAHAIARTLGAQPGDTPQQSVDRFVGWMNERIRNMGLVETDLQNPHGLGEPGHVSSAHDLAAFTRYALQFPMFQTVIGTATYQTSGYSLSNTNRLLSIYGDFGGLGTLIGGKTGFDQDSGYCLVEVARNDGNTMISVTLDGTAPDVWYQDNAILLNYAFEQKAARVAENRPISGEVVTFVDPDAALLAQIVTPGASLGQEAAEQTNVQASVATPLPTAVPSPVVADLEPSSSSDNDWSFFAAILVAAAVIIAAVVMAVVSPATITGSSPKAPDPAPPTSSKKD